MKRIEINASQPYPVLADRCFLSEAGTLIRRCAEDAGKAAVVTDDIVDGLYGDAVTESIRGTGFAVCRFILPHGEASKNGENYLKLLNFLAEERLSRSDLIVALGGGVVGDLAGFAAATYLRGIRYIQIPTTLLAQVDSSVGGKTGVDLPQGKNLVGAFHQPLAVLIDPDTLNTLPEPFVTDGMGEVIKYGCIKDAAFFEKLETESFADHIEDIIETCVSIKRDVVSRDEREKGERMLLNFGHTLGHAIEKLGDFSAITHGKAVAIGMVLMARAGEQNGYTEKGTAERIIRLCEKYQLPTEWNAAFSDMAEAAKGDKKTAGSDINLVLLKTIGDSFTLRLPLEELNGFIDTTAPNISLEE